MNVGVFQTTGAMPAHPNCDTTLKLKPRIHETLRAEFVLRIRKQSRRAAWKVLNLISFEAARWLATRN